MRRRKTLRSFSVALIGLFTVCWHAAGATQPDSPVELIEGVASTLAQRVERDRERLESDPAELWSLVDEVFLPAFDTELAARLVLGRHWRSATPEQRQQFIDAFYSFLVQSYAQSVLKFRSDRLTVYPLPDNRSGNPDRAVVRTTLKLDDGTTLSVNYSLRRKAVDGWRIYDVQIEGVSYVRNYRNQFDAEITARGLDAVIDRIRSETPGKGGSAEAAAGSDAGGKAGDGP